MSDGRVVIDTRMNEEGIDKGRRSIEGKLNGLSKTAGNITNSLKTMAVGAFAAMGVRGISELTKMGIESAAVAQEMSAQYEQVFAGMTREASDALNRVSNETNILPNRLKPAMIQMAAFAKTAGMDTAESLELSERAMRVAADSTAWFGGSIEATTESLQSFLKGNFENDAALGISATETTRNAKANELYGQSFKDLSEAQKQLTLLAMVEDGQKLSGALGQAAREGEGYENVLGNLKRSWTDFMAILGQPMMEVAIKGMQWLTDVILDAGGGVQQLSNWFSMLWGQIQSGEGFLGTIVSRFKSFATLIQEAFSEGNFSQVGNLANGLLTMLINTLLGGVPRLLQLGADLINRLADGMGMSIPEMVQAALAVITSFIFGFLDNIPLLMNTGMQVLQGLISGIMTAIPTLLTTVTEVLNILVSTLTMGVPQFLFLGMEVLLMLIEGIISLIPTLIPVVMTLLDLIVTTITSNLGMIIDAGIKLLEGIIDGILMLLPDLMATALTLVQTIVDTVASNLPAIIDAGVRILNSIVDGIVKMLPSLISMAVELIMTLFNTLIQNLPTILEAGVQLLLAVVDGVLRALPEIFSAAEAIGDTIMNVLGDIDWLSLGAEIVNGIAAGISAFGGAIWSTLEGIVSSAWGSVKEFFGIASPSRLMRDTIGRYIPEGMAVGMEMEAGSVEDAADMLARVAIPDMSGIGISRQTVAKGASSVAVPVPFTASAAEGATSADLNELKGLLQQLLRKDTSLYIDSREIARAIANPIREETSRLDAWDEMLRHGVRPSQA